MFAVGEGPIALPRGRQAGREPKVLVWEPNLQTDGTGVAQLELPPIAVGKRLRVSVLAVANGRVAGANVVLGQDTPARTAALSPIAVPSLLVSSLRQTAASRL
jgi:hypothetical protein